jgi:hypothetical protein
MRCNGCGTEIQFIAHAKTCKKIPCEKELKAGDGKMTLVTIDGWVIPKAGQNTKGYEPHWARCTVSEVFRRGKI